MTDRFQIFVRYNSSTNIPVRINPGWNVRRLKEEITQDQDVNPSDIRIIFAGRELRDDFSLRVSFFLRNSILQRMQLTHLTSVCDYVGKKFIQL